MSTGYETYGWQLWKCETTEHHLIEQFAYIGLEPFAVDNGTIWWRQYNALPDKEGK